MEGTITFDSVEDLGEFLKAFTGSTAIFKVSKDIGKGKYVLEFTGGF